MAARNVAFVALAMAALVGVHAVVPADNTDMHETHDWLNEFNDLEQLVHVDTTRSYVFMWRPHRPPFHVPQ